MYRCVDLVQKHAEAAERGRSEKAQTGEPGSIMFVVARFYAVTSAWFRQDREMRLDDRERLAEEYAVRAVQQLAKLRAAGFFAAPHNLEKLKTDRDLDPLRGRPDFQRLLAQLDGKSAGR
jgi:hypothetical protein